MLTVGSILTTNVSQTSLCQLLFRATISQAWLMFVTTLGMDSFDCTKMFAHFKTFRACLREGVIHEWKQALLAPPSPLMLVKKKKTHSSVPHTATVDISFLQHCSTNSKLRIPVKAQPSTPNTWPLSPTRLGIRPWDLGLLNEYSLGHCGLSAASRHKLTFTSRHHALLTATETTALY